MSDAVKKVVLAYSGGLDTSVAFIDRRLDVADAFIERRLGG